MVEIGIVSVCGNTMCYLNYREAEVQVLNHISHLATVEIRVVRLGSFQNLYLSFIVEITHGVTANRDDNNNSNLKFRFEKFLHS